MNETSSPCPNKDVCGSCGWSHIPYEKQLAQKLSDINGSLALHHVALRCEEITPSPKTTHYRNRMDFVIDFEGRVGLRQKGKWWKVIDNHPCFLGDERIEQGFHEARNWAKSAGLSFYDRKSFQGFLRYAVLRSNVRGELMLIVVTSAPDTETSESFTELLKQSSAEHIIWSISHGTSDVSFGDELITLRGKGYLQESIDQYSFRVTPNAFFQTNSHGAALLAKSVLGRIEQQAPTKVLDLYCGSGFFSIPVAGLGIPTIGVELVESAIEDARLNAEDNSVQAEFIAAKSEDYPWEQLGADLIIVDPPRSGMHDRALQRLISYKPRSIVYVSCNYKQLARELPFFLPHYEVRQIEAIDMFPHTPHVETVLTLVLKEEGEWRY
jgi:23S rRNA (uracil-5-)-methyltransferase RumA